MAFPDPVTITVGGTAQTLDRIQTGSTDGLFRGSNLSLEIVPSTNRSGRSVVAARLTRRKVTTDPLVSTTNVEVKETVTIAFNRPAAGFSTAETKELYTALAAMLTASSGAMLTKLINQES